MMKDITSFLPVVLWQGFLRPIDLRIEIETFNEDLQVQGSSQYLKFRPEEQGLNSVKLTVTTYFGARNSLKVYGKLFHLTLNLLMVYFCMNFIISFITEAHGTANEKVKQRSDWTEYFHYLGKCSTSHQRRF